MAGDSRLVNVFISYAHEDRKWCIRLRDQLGALTNLGQIRLFDDGEVRAGQRWDSRIREELEAADIIVLIVSDKFMASKYSTTVELRHAVESSASGSVCVIPVVADHVDIEALPFHDLQFFPLDDNLDLKPLVDWKKGEVSRPLADIARRIRQEVERLKGRGAEPAPTTGGGVPPYPPRRSRLPHRGIAAAGAIVAIALLAGVIAYQSRQPATSSGSGADSVAQGASTPAPNANPNLAPGPATPDGGSNPVSVPRGGGGNAGGGGTPPPAQGADAGGGSGVVQTAGNQGQPTAGGPAQRDPVQPPGNVVPPPAPSPEDARAQLVAQASAIVDCVQRTRDETAAVEILRILKVQQTSYTTAGILADLRNSWSGAAPEDRQRAIVRQVHCLDR